MAVVSVVEIGRPHRLGCASTLDSDRFATLLGGRWIKESKSKMRERGNAKPLPMPCLLRPKNRHIPRRSLLLHLRSKERSHRGLESRKGSSAHQWTANVKSSATRRFRGVGGEGIGGGRPRRRTGEYLRGVVMWRLTVLLEPSRGTRLRSLFHRSPTRNVFVNLLRPPALPNPK